MSDSTGRALAWQQLLRSANVFTAASNVLAGFLIVQKTGSPLPPLLWLIAASVLLYEAGMVLNDAFDAEIDAQERPDRPIPSGRITRQAAFAVGWLMLAGGVVAGAAASRLAGHFTPLACAAALALAVVAYDAWVKHTPVGPIALGLCRALNVLLGASWAPVGQTPGGAWLYAAAIGVYTIGFSLIAKHEAEETGEAAASHTLRDGEVLCLGGFMAVAAAPLIFSDLGRHIAFFFVSAPIGWWVLSATRNVVRDPCPGAMRTSVTRLILGFILLDGWIACMAAGLGPGLIVWALFLPALFASRKVAMT